MGKSANPAITLPLQEAVPLPDGAAHLWEVFRQLDLARGHTEAGPLPISHTEILAWCILYEDQLSVWEIEAIRALDGVALRRFARQQEARLKEAQERARSRSPAHRR